MAVVEPESGGIDQHSPVVGVAATEEGFYIFLKQTRHKAWEKVISVVLVKLHSHGSTWLC